MRLAIALLLALAASPARAGGDEPLGDPPAMLPPIIDVGAAHYLIFPGAEKAPQPIVAFGVGSCVRGPVTFYAADQTKAFEIARGTSFPEGCDQQ